MRERSGEGTFDLSLWKACVLGMSYLSSESTRSSNPQLSAGRGEGGWGWAYGGAPRRTKCSRVEVLCSEYTTSAEGQGGSVTHARRVGEGLLIPACSMAFLTNTLREGQGQGQGQVRGKLLRRGWLTCRYLHGACRRVGS